METRDSFYIELLSNAQLNIYPENRIGRFFNNFAGSVSLDGLWEVGLVEIAIPPKLYNVDDGIFTATVSGTTKNLSIRSGLFIDHKDIIDEMNDAINEAFHTKKVSYILSTLHRVPGILSITMKKTCELKLTGRNLRDIFGFVSQDANDPVVTIRPNQTSIAELHLDLARFHHVFVYCDIVENTRVAHTQVPLLRAFSSTQPNMEGFELSETTNATNYQRFNSVQYKRVNQNNFNRIQITLRDASGQLLPFVSLGVARCTLHFRKIKSNALFDHD